MTRAASVALLLASILTASLEAQRAGAGFHAFGPTHGQSAHTGRRGFSNGHLPDRFQRSYGLGAFLSPYFFAEDDRSLHEEVGEPLGPEPGPQLYAPERERLPAPAQVIEIPVAAHPGAVKPSLPAMFVLTNGERLEAQRFVLTVSSLSVNIGRRERVVPVEALDLDATTAANRERGVNLQIPTDHNEISLSF